MSNNKTVSSFLWKFLERGGYVGIQFVVQIVLARLIDPALFGVMTIMLTFMNLVQVFTQNGLNMALVQNQEVTEDDYSTVFYVNFAIMALFYLLFFAGAKAIENFYHYENFVAPFRILLLCLFAMALSSVQLAKLTKELRFKTIFKCSLLGVVLSGAIGIYMAYRNYGIWALVAQYLLNQFLNAAALIVAVKWRPRMVFSSSRVKVLFSFGGKLMLGSMLSSLNDNFRSFIIGKYTGAADLAFYKRGKLFPQTGANIIKETTQSVMFPLLSERQGEPEEMLKMLRKTMSFSAYIVTPALLGMLAVSRPLISVLLTDKWLPAVPYMQIACVAFIFYQMHYIYTQALNSKGLSGITLSVNTAVIGGSFTTCLIAMLVFRSTILVSWGTLAVVLLIALPLDMFFCQKYLDYSLSKQFADVLPSILISIAMLAVVMTLRLLALSEFVLLILQIIAGIVSYVALSALFKVESYKSAVKIAKGFFR